MDAQVETFTASQLFDRRLAEQDIAGSSAHARMLCHCGILTEDERDAIIAGLKTILEEVQTDCFPWSDEHEDVHMNIEARLIGLIAMRARSFIPRGPEMTRLPRTCVFTCASILTASMAVSALCKIH